MWPEPPKFPVGICCSQGCGDNLGETTGIRSSRRCCQDVQHLAGPRVLGRGEYPPFPNTLFTAAQAGPGTSRRDTANKLPTY